VTEGLHGKPPFGEFIIWPKTTQTAHEKLTCLSSDGVVCTIILAFQYTVVTTKIHQLTLDYQDFGNWKLIMSYKARSGIRNACAKFMAQEFQTKRSLVQTKMNDDLRLRLNKAGSEMGATILDLQLTQVDRPASYELAVDAKENARNNIDKVKNDKDQLITKANTDLLKAQIAANKTTASANTAAVMTKATAAAEAAIVMGKYTAQASTFKQAKADASLSDEGLLAYLAIRLTDELTGITLGMEKPAQLAYGAALT